MLENLKIKREIGGEPMEMELTFDEMFTAREMVEFSLMREDIQDFHGEDIPAAILDELAETAWNYVKYNDMSFSEARQAAMDDWDNGDLTYG